VSESSARVAALEPLPLEAFNPPPTTSSAAFDRQGLESILTTHAPQALHRDLEYRGSFSEGAWYSSRLLWPQQLFPLSIDMIRFGFGVRLYAVMWSSPSAIQSKPHSSAKINCSTWDL